MTDAEIYENFILLHLRGKAKRGLKNGRVSVKGYKILHDGIPFVLYRNGRFFVAKSARSKSKEFVKTAKGLGCEIKWCLAAETLAFMERTRYGLFPEVS